MLNAITPELSREFRNRAEAARRERLLRHYNQDRDRHKRLEDAEAADDDFLDVVTSVLSATELNAFREDLNLYDAATVAALQDNERALTETGNEMEELLGQAYVLSDGRRIFKSKDGIRVFDEHGERVGPSTLHPDLIEGQRPTWERYKPVRDEMRRLLKERQGLLAYQSRLDVARDRLDRGDLDRGELQKLRQDLKASMPVSVRRHATHLEGGRKPAHDDGPPPAARDATAPETLDLSPNATPDTMAPKI